MPVSPLDLYSEPYAPTGNIGDGGFQKLLGTPAQDILETVLRESIQNSTDAAKLGVGPEVLIRIRKLSQSEINAFRDLSLSSLPSEERSRSALLAFLNRECPRVMEICDFNTTGLGGPTRADVIKDKNESVDFINFLRNVGSSRDTKNGGGTYGFGKASLYLASRCSTIFVDTLTSFEDGHRRRFMGCHLGRAFHSQSEGSLIRRFTGRHWWGRLDSSDGFVDPLTHDDAASLSKLIGLPERNNDRTGTSIMIIDPYVDDDMLKEIGGRIAERVLFFFWPRMTRGAPADRRLSVRIEVDGKEIPVPAPEDFPPLNLFASALESARQKGDKAEVIECHRPVKRLGLISIEKGYRLKRELLVSSDSVFPSQSAHIALMRPAELIVKYVEGTPYPDETIEWAGVFVVDDEDEVEKAFADAEPPAHDDWEPKSMPPGRAKTFVNVALRRIREKALSVVQLGDMPVPDDASSGQSLAHVSDRLGAMLGSGATGGVSSRSSRGGSKGARKRKVSRPLFARLENGSRGPVAIFQFQVSGASESTLIDLRPELAMDGGFVSSDYLAEADRPAVLNAVSDPPGAVLSGHVITVVTASARIEVAISIPADCAVSLKAAFVNQEA